LILWGKRLKGARGRRGREIYDKLSYSFIEIIEKIQGTSGLPTITSLAEEMGMHVSTLWRRVKTLHDSNVVFMADINYSGLGIKRLLAISKKGIRGKHYDSPFLELEAPLIPKGVLLQYAAPAERLDEIVEKLRVEDVEGDVYIFDNYYHSKPNLRAYYDVVNRKVRPRWDYLLETVKASEFQRIVTPKRRIKYDEIDLFILEQIESDPFLSMREIANRLQEAVSKGKWRIEPEFSNVTYSRVRRHFLNHIIGRGMVTGVHIKISHRPENLDIVLIYKTRDQAAHRISSALAEHPYTDYTLSNEDGTMGLTWISVPPQEVRGLLELFDTLQQDGMILEWEGYIVDKYHVSRKKISFRNYL
jgi:DNA-binding Lrp family transcriptional regulator